MAFFNVGHTLSSPSTTETQRMEPRVKSVMAISVEPRSSLRVSRVRPCAERPIESIPALAPSIAATDAEKGELPRAKEELVAALVSLYYSRVHAFVRKRESIEVADDVTQEVFFRIMKLQNLEKMTLEVGYLLRIAENLLKRRASQKSRFQEVLLQSGRVGSHAIEAKDRGRGAELWVGREAAANAHQGTRSIDAEDLGRVLALLPVHESSAVRMIVCNGLSYEAAGNALAVPASTVNNWKHRGLQRLRQLIEASDDQESTTPLAPGDLRLTSPNRDFSRASIVSRRSRSFQSAGSGRAIATIRSSDFSRGCNQSCAG
jgi:RNA polymerase sigma factor (sigma-70 family)